MSLDSLLAALKSEVAEGAGVQASRNSVFACNPPTFERVAEATAVAAEIHTATPETLAGQSEVAAQPAPIEACTHETLETQKAIRYEVGSRATATTFRWWLIHFSDRDPVELASSPDATHTEILQRHPDALAAEPFTPRNRQPSAPFSIEEERDIRAWLALIRETDPEIIAEVMQQCQSNADARDYFTRRAAAELPKIDPFPDDRRTCKQCTHLSAGACSAAKRGEIMASPTYQPAPDQLRRCEAYRPGPDDPDARSGGERWLGLVVKVED